MRGASALGTLLGTNPAAKVRMLVIWLPVIASDKGPPTDEVRKPLQDPRVVEFWDPKHWASPRMMERATRMLRAQGREPDFGPDAIAWDLIGLFPSGADWEEPFPEPVWYGGPVVDVLEPVQGFLSGVSPIPPATPPGR